MEISNGELVGRLLDRVKSVLLAFLEQELAICYGRDWREKVRALIEWPDPARKEAHQRRNDAYLLKDTAAVLTVTDRCWNDIRRRTGLSRKERALVNELRETRNQWAHDTPFSAKDVHRAMDSAQRLLTAIGCSQPVDNDVEQEILRRSNSLDVGAWPVDPHATAVPTTRPNLAELHEERTSNCGLETSFERDFPLVRARGSKFQLAVTPHFRSPNYSLLDGYGLADLRGLLVDAEVDNLSMVAQIEEGVQEAVRSGLLARGEKLSPHQITLPSEVSSDSIVTLAFRNLEQKGVLYLEKRGFPLWIVV